MKVWELIAILHKQQAGADVVVARDSDTHRFLLHHISENETDEEMVVFIGDGSTSECSL